MLLELLNMTARQVLLQRIRALGGLSTTAEASTALRATLAALGDRLPDDERAVIARGLPDDLGSILGKRSYRGAFDVAQLFDRVARREGVSLGFAREHAQVTLRALGESLPEETLQYLERVLPVAFVELLLPPPAVEPPPDHRPAHRARHNTLATGKPGSAHPLSDSHSPLAQKHSVALESNPHADTKLSSASGTTQERLEESLGTAHPATQRSISDNSK